MEAAPKSTCNQSAKYIKTINQSNSIRTSWLVQQWITTGTQRIAQAQNHLTPAPPAATCWHILTTTFILHQVLFMDFTWSLICPKTSVRTSYEKTRSALLIKGAEYSWYQQQFSDILYKVRISDMSHDSGFLTHPAKPGKYSTAY